jgi:hypothetical protein
MTTPLTDAGYWQTRERLARLEARLKSLGARTDLDPVLRAEAARSFETKIRESSRDLALYEAANPGLASTSPPAGMNRVPRPLGAADWLRNLVEEGVIDPPPPLPDAVDTDAFEPIRVEGRPISEEIIEDRR